MSLIVYLVFLEIKVELSVERFCPDFRIRFKRLQSRDHEHIFGFDWRVSSRARMIDLLIQTPSAVSSDQSACLLIISFISKACSVIRC